ncbi:MAG: PorP/SprF family type IX secretion system membrane protein [Saprospiraceae bacterium]
MKKFFLLTLCFFSFSLAVFSQDKHFTQFYAAPLTLNPALSGNFEGKYRVGMIYRDQWRSILDNPIKSFALGADLRFDAPGKSVYDDAVGLGILFFNDKVSVVDFNTTQIALSLAYHKALGVDNRQYLSIGLQGGLTQRSVNYESLNFNDEFEGNGFTGPTSELLPENNIAYTDYNVGLNYTARFGQDGAVFAGAALHHFLQPVISFNRNKNEGDKLYMKMSGQLAATIPVNRQVSFQPRLLVAVQGPHMEVNAGANFRTEIGQYGSTALHIGGWARPVRNSDGFGLDAVVGLVGIEFSNVLVGVSYDLNLHALSANQRQGAFELSIAYLGNYDSEEILCPKF